MIGQYNLLEGGDSRHPDLYLSYDSIESMHSIQFFNKFDGGGGEFVPGTLIVTKSGKEYKVMGLAEFVGRGWLKWAKEFSCTQK
jgi:hypothetical protein